MNKLLSAILISGIYILSGCGPRQAEYDPTIVPEKSETKVSAADTSKPAAAISVPGLSEPVKTAPAITSTSAPVVTSTSAPVTQTAPGMNPPHGQPGHKCELAVGAPLNSKPTTTSVTPPPIKTEMTSAQPASTPVQVAAPVTNAAGKRLNPAHGQPGHDCSIAVGQPLKN